MNTEVNTDEIRDRAFTRRNYMIYRSVMEGVHALQAMEAVSSWAIDHPQVDMDEEMTWAEWEAYERGSKVS